MQSCRRLLNPSSVLLFVGVCYLAAVVLRGGTNRFLNWDEAVYYSQVAPDTHPAELSASRSRGVTWMIYPIVATGADLPLVRTLIATMHTALMLLAFGIWMRIVGTAAVLAAALFCLSWITVFYGGEISPNLPSALFSVAAVGLAVRSMAEGRRLQILACIAFCCLALVRPTDSVWISLGMGIGTLTLFPRQVFRVCVGPAVGAVLGWLPWLIEAEVRFGGVTKRLNAAKKLVEGSGGLDVLLWHARVVNGPLYQQRPKGDISWEGVLWWGCLLTFALAGLWLVRKRASLKPALIALLCSLAVFAAYIFTAGVARPRYLLPSYALISVPAAIGLWEALRPLKIRFPVFAAIVVFAFLGLGWSWHGKILAAISKRESKSRAKYVAWGDVVREAARGRPCALGTGLFGPPVGVRSGCFTKVLWSSNASSVEDFLDERACAGDAVFLLADKRRVKKERKRNKRKRQPISFSGWKSRAVMKRIRLYEPPVQGRDYCALLEKRKKKARSR
jgi:hypothetical protein